MDKNILEQDYKSPIITEGTIENIKNHPRFYMHSPMTTQTGRLYTSEEFRRRSDEILKELFPGEKKSVLQKVLKKIKS